MAEFSKLMLTNAGRAMNTAVLAGADKIQYTKVKTTAVRYSAEEVDTLSELAEVRQSSDISSITVIDDNTVKLEAAFTNEALAEGYYVRTLGLYALDHDKNEILYAAAIAAEDNCYMSAFGSVTSTGAVIHLFQTVGDAEKVSMEVVPTVFVTSDEYKKNNVRVNELIQESVESSKEEVNARTDELLSKSISDVKDEVAANVANVRNEMESKDQEISDLIQTNVASVRNEMNSKDKVISDLIQTNTTSIRNDLNSQNISLTSAISKKADLVSSAVSGNFAALNAAGNIINSGKKPADFAPNTDASTITGGKMSAADKIKLNGIATGANNYVHPNSGVTSGTYNNVTVNAQGHITAASNVSNAKTSHASTSSTYGVGNKSNYGHIKLMDEIDQADLTGTGVNTVNSGTAATPYMVAGVYEYMTTNCITESRFACRTTPTLTPVMVDSKRVYSVDYYHTQTYKISEDSGFVVNIPLSSTGGLPIDQIMHGYWGYKDAASGRRVVSSLIGSLSSLPNTSQIYIRNMCGSAIPSSSVIRIHIEYILA